MPEVMTVDRTVGEPERAMVGMVLLLVGTVLIHGEIPGQIVSGRSNEGIEVGEVVIGAVFGDESLPAKDLEGLVVHLLAKLGGGI